MKNTKTIHLTEAELLEIIKNARGVNYANAEYYGDPEYDYTISELVKTAKNFSKERIKIVQGKLGYALRIADKYIHVGFLNYPKAILQGVNGSLVGKATEFSSIQALKKYYSSNRLQILEALKHPYVSENGTLRKL
jgi:hypothetical protein